MRTSNTIEFIGLLLLGCSTERTIANESESSQSMSVIARPVCVEMCRYSIDCARITANELGDCLNQCETDCTRLEAAAPSLVNPANGDSASAAGTIQSVHACYLASECSLQKPKECYPEFIGTQANIVEGKPEPSLTGTMGISSCGMREDALTCDSTIAQNRDNAEAWSVTCERADVTATAWTCHCAEYGIEVATVAGTPAIDDPAMLELCWTETQLACFYGGKRGCGRTSP